MPHRWYRLAQQLPRVSPLTDAQVTGRETFPVIWHGETHSMTVDQIINLSHPGHSGGDKPPSPDPHPVGTVVAVLGPVPDGWLACDGATVSRAAHPALFEAIGESFGAGDGTATFQLPTVKTALTTGKGPAVRWIVKT